MRAERAVRGVVAALIAAGLLGGVFAWLQAPPEGPVPVAWDRVACARCRMLVGDPSFAAQLQIREGVLHFDDPGCLLLYVHERAPEVRATWFHHHAEDRWIRGERVRFVEVGASPMGYGLGASDAQDSAPYTRAAALQHALAREALRTGG